MRRSPLVALAVAGLLVLAACGDGDTADGAADQPATSLAVGAVETTAAAAGSPAPSTAEPGAPATSSSAETGTGAGVATAPAPTTPPVTVPEILDVTAETVSDGPLSLAAFAGKPVALWFWAPG